MRQIYNTAESPEMTIFQLMDTMVPSVGNVANNNDTTCINHTVNQILQPVIESSNYGQTSSCRNTSRLSLANLLPSRLAFYPLYIFFLYLLQTKHHEQYIHTHYDLLHTLIFSLI